MIVKGRLSWSDRLIVVIVYRHPQLILDLRRLSADLSVNVDVTIDYFHGFSRSANQSFDIIYCGVKRIFEHYYIPLFWFEELIEALEDKYPVAV